MVDNILERVIFLLCYIYINRKASKGKETKPFTWQSKDKNMEINITKTNPKLYP